MFNRHQETIVRCGNCGAEIGRGDNLGFTSAICAHCSNELFPQFKKDPAPPYVPPPWPVPLQQATAPELSIDAATAPPPSNKVAIGLYEEEAPVREKLKKPVAKKKKPGKTVSKAIKSLGRFK